MTIPLKLTLSGFGEEGTRNGVPYKDTIDNLNITYEAPFKENDE